MNGAKLLSVRKSTWGFPRKPSSHGREKPFPACAKKIIRIAGKGGKTLDEYAEKLSRIQQFRPIDDTFFEVIVKDKEACQEILRVLLDDPAIVVESVQTQRSLKNIFGRSLRLDALCRLKGGTIVTIEVQRKDDDDHVARISIRKKIRPRKILRRIFSHSFVIKSLFECCSPLAVSKSSFTGILWFAAFFGENPFPFFSLFGSAPAKSPNAQPTTMVTPKRKNIICPISAIPIPPCLSLSEFSR